MFARYWFLIPLMGISFSGITLAQSSIEDEFQAAIEQDQADENSHLQSTQENTYKNGTPNITTTQSFNNSFNPAMSFILDVGIGWFSDHPIAQGGHALDQTGFGLQGLEFAGSANVDPFFRFDMYFELGHLHLEEAFLTSLSLPWNLQIRAGYMNAKFGRENPLHIHNWSFSNPSLAHTRFMAEEHFAGLGGEVSVLLPLPWYALVTAQVFDTNAHYLAIRSSSFQTVDFTQTGEIDGFEDFLYVGRFEQFFELHDDWSLLLGLNASFGQSPYVPDNRVALYGVDLYVKWRPISKALGYRYISLTAEYMMRDSQIPGDSVRDYGGYVQLEGSMSKYWNVSWRVENTGTLHGVAPVDSSLFGWSWRNGIAMTYLPTHFSKIRLQYDIGNSQLLQKRYHAVMMQLEISAGKHGAHEF